MKTFSYFAAGDIVKSEPEPKENITFEDYIGRVRGPVFAPFTDFVKSKPYGSDEYREAKKVLPFITPHAVVARKCNDAVLKRSGLFCYDLDLKDNPGIDLAAFSERLRKNPYCIGYHASPSGGVSFYISVAVDLDTWENHNKEYMTLFDELQHLYGVTLDKAQKAISQARYCSHDPEAYYNPDAKAKIITIAPPVTRQPIVTTKEQNHMIVESVRDFLHQAGATITKTYDEWVWVGFALANTFDEKTAQTYFHEISAVDSCYDFDECHEVFNRISRSVASGSPEKPLRIDYIIDKARAAGWHAPNEVAALIPEEEDTFEQTKKGGHLLAFAEYAKTLNIKRNEITRLLDINGEQMQDKDFHTIWLRCHTELNINISKEDVFSVLDSDITPTYNPLIEYFESLPVPGPKSESLIYRLSTTVEQDTYDPAFFWTLLKKWMVATVAGIYPGRKNILQMVLSGRQNTGKTEFFRRLLPAEIHPFYAENKLDDGKDSEILMCQKLIIMDDEFGGKSKIEVKRVKELSSKVEVTVRLPYGKTPVTLNRIATLCGTTNDPEILGDTTGNRRIIPVNVVGRDFVTFDKIDKRKLWGEAVGLFKSGFDYELNREEIARLEGLTDGFNRYSQEYELITQYFSPPLPRTSKADIRMMSATEILVVLKDESKINNLSHVQLGKELKRLGYEQKHVRDGESTVRKYAVVRRML